MKRTNLLLAAAFAAMPIAGNAGEPLTAFDVAEDISRFVFAAAPVFDDSMPAYGNPFVTQGYIYPAGTLDGGVEGALPNGDPAFPELVIGEWTCDGYFVGDGMRTGTGAIVMTRQVYRFKDGDLLISHGPELVDPGVTVTRAVTGGTGDYSDTPAELDQVLLGMSDGFGVRLSIAFPGEDRADASGQTPTFADRDTALDAQDYGHWRPGEEDHTERDSGFPLGPVPSLAARDAG